MHTHTDGDINECTECQNRIREAYSNHIDRRIKLNDEYMAAHRELEQQWISTLNAIKNEHIDAQGN